MTATFDPIPPDIRSIDDMQFGSGAPDPLSVAKNVRAVLRKCGVNVAHEIEELGCTGASAKGLSITEIFELRMGLGGGGVGLPCFVPPSRYCLAHSTIGGLQIGQLGRFPEEIMKISRELSPRERGSVELIEASRRVRGGDLAERLMNTADALSGRDLPPGVEHDESDTGFEDGEAYRQVAEQPSRSVRSTTVTEVGPGMAFVCPEHAEPLWSCRYCVAQMIVEGPLEPIYRVQGIDREGRNEGPTVELPANGVEEALENWPSVRAEAYVRVATFRRKLARD